MTSPRRAPKPARRHQARPRPREAVSAAAASKVKAKVKVKAKAKVKAGKPQAAARAAAKPAATGSAKVRMYRQGLGDCFLITLPRTTGRPFFIMIDCGVILGTSDAAATMQAVVADIDKTTGGRVDLLLATHEHWDHLSGFVQAKDQFQRIKFDNVWLGWTEDPDDELAQKLGAEHLKLRVALAAATARLHLGGGSDGVVDGMLEFFGAAG